LLEGHDDIYLSYDVYIRKGVNFNLNWVNQNPHEISSELIIWLPLHFTSTRKEGASFKFPEGLGGIGETLKSLSGMDVFESVALKIAISPRNPFGGGKKGGAELVIQSDGLDDIRTPMDNTNLVIALSESELNYINNNTFEPQFSIFFPKGSELDIPSKEIIATTISLEAKLKFEVDLAGGDSNEE
jgi:hypothetical protein